jgi:hypothetical protein
VPAAEQTDEAHIVSISADADGNSVVQLDRPLLFTHLGEIVDVPGDEYGRKVRCCGVGGGQGGRIPRTRAVFCRTCCGCCRCCAILGSSPCAALLQVDMRAEVAVLSRNVVLQGDEASAVSMYGMQMLISTPPSKPRAVVQLQNLEVRRSGQAFRLGRYSIHFHMHGDVAFNSYLKNCTIHHTYSRALAVHGTHRLNISYNVGYHAMGHMFFIEDGAEVGGMPLNR